MFSIFNVTSLNIECIFTLISGHRIPMVLNREKNERLRTKLVKGQVAKRWGGAVQHCKVRTWSEVGGGKYQKALS